MSAVIARARGLEARLLDRAALDELAGARSLPALARALAERGLAAGDDAATLDADLRRVAAERLASLARWGDATLAVEDEDRRTVIGVLRRVGTAGGVPTPRLPERAVAALSGARTLPALAEVLRAWGHPYAAALDAGSRAAAEGAVHRIWASRLLRAARDRFERAFAAVEIGLHNLQSLAIGCGQPAASRVDAWLPGGAWLDHDAYTEALAAGAPRVVPDGPLAGLDPRDPRFELDALTARIAALRRPSLEHPLSAAPVLRYVLRLRAERADLRSLVWSVAFGRAAPRWVTP